MSWSEGRTTERELGASQNVNERIDKLLCVNGVLRKLSQDEDLHDELKLKPVKIALDHWTGKKRLPPKEAKKIQEQRSCIYVFQRLQMLQHASHTAGIASPLDHLLQKKPKLDISLATQLFGDDILNSPKFPRDVYTEDLREIQKLQQMKLDRENLLNNRKKSPSSSSTNLFESSEVKAKQQVPVANASNLSQQNIENTDENDDESENDNHSKLALKSFYNNLLFESLFVVLLSAAVLIIVIKAVPY